MDRILISTYSDILSELKICTNYTRVQTLKLLADCQLKKINKLKTEKLLQRVGEKND